MINNYVKSVTLINELYDIIKMFPEEANNEGLRSATEGANDKYLRSAKSSPRIKNSGTGI